MIFYTVDLLEGSLVVRPQNMGYGYSKLASFITRIDRIWIGFAPHRARVSRYVKTVFVAVSRLNRNVV
jgi:hypothetical protein